MATLEPLTLDPPLDPTAIRRTLFTAHPVHIYSIPPLPSTRGHLASLWTSPPSREIFTARLLILETSVPSPPSSPSASSSAPTAPSSPITTTLHLLDPTTSHLFASAPYTSPHCISQALDSSRFFAIRVVSADGRQAATLGMGFEEREVAFEFGVVVAGVRRGLGMEEAGPGGRPRDEAGRDFRLKEGETIRVDFGGKGRGAKAGGGVGDEEAGTEAQHRALFSIKPPPGPGPKASSMGEGATGKGGGLPEGVKAEDLGFDDGEFGEFQ